MAVNKVGEEYRCNVCGNEVTVTKAGGGKLVCCGKDMEKTPIGHDAWDSASMPDSGGGNGGGGDAG